MRRVLVRNIRKNGGGKIYNRTFPSSGQDVTSKPAKTRMGKGKGSFLYKVSPISPGQILFEIGGGFSQEQAIKMLKQASQKLPVLTRIVTRNTAEQKARREKKPRTSESRQPLPHGRDFCPPSPRRANGFWDFDK